MIDANGFDYYDHDNNYYAVVAAGHNCSKKLAKHVILWRLTPD